MIRYALACGKGHGFEAWFGSCSAYDERARARAIACPHCGSGDVSKAPMAPALAKGRPEPKASEQGEGKRAQLYASLRELRAELTANAEDVGRKFPEEA